MSKSPLGFISNRSEQNVLNELRPISQTYAVLVVGVFDLGHIQTLFCVELLLLLQNPVVEELLELLVAVVNAELLERIQGEEFEAGDVQDADVALAMAERNRFVDRSHNEVEEAAIDRLRERISRGVRFAHL
ncbi:hypothetical protein L596_007623 [Steinernema carpocapsae]|uniref:Uncharacterized protein n=1 Tax=Steinernema carpocapsae TaxID=34508 RepID=A0A4U5P9Y5_STECR|nr:hypothetical protein L596_007623 [Steinernema carpocapsae]